MAVATEFVTGPALCFSDLCAGVCTSPMHMMEASYGDTPRNTLLIFCTHTGILMYFMFP